MTIEEVKRTSIYWDYSNPPDEHRIAELNRDLFKMETQVQITFKITPDGITIIFTKENTI